MRVLLKKVEGDWRVRFMHGNPWKMPIGEWLPISATAREAPAHVIEAFLIGAYPGANPFTVIPIGDDLVASPN